MKHLLMVGLLVTSAIVLSEAAAHAQATPSFGTAKTQSAPLVTQPASTDRTSIGSRSSTQPYTADQLNRALGSLEAKPKPQSQQGNSIGSLLQKVTPNQTPSSIDPIDFFKPPGLNGGVKVPLQQ